MHKFFSFNNGVLSLFGLIKIRLFFCILDGGDSTTSVNDNSNVASQYGDVLNLDGMTVGGYDNTVIIESLDSDVIKAANDLSSQALATVDKATTNAFLFGDSVTGKAINLSALAVDRVFDYSAGIARDNAAAAKDSLRAAVENSQDAQNRVLAFAQGRSTDSIDNERNTLYLAGGLLMFAMFAVLSTKGRK